MDFVRIAYQADNEGRVKHFEAHKAHLHAGLDIIVMSGPLVSTESDKRVGSLVIFKAASLAEVEAWNAGDPFIVHNVYKDVQILRYEKSLG